MNQLKIFMEKQKKHGRFSSVDRPIYFVGVRGSVDDIALCIREEYEEVAAVPMNTTTGIMEEISAQMVREGLASLDITSALLHLRTTRVNPEGLRSYLGQITTDTFPLDLGERGLSASVRDNLEALSVSAELLRQCSSATIPMKISNLSLKKGKWFPHAAVKADRAIPDLMQGLTRAQSFACICMLESGGIDVGPSYFERAFALSAGNSLYVARVLLKDPADSGPDWLIERIVGNIGIPGISVIVSAEILRVADAPDDPRAIQHQPYNDRREDSFSGVTMHLSMTDWRVPVPTGAVGHIDQDLFLTEAYVSVHDGGKWYADIDVLAARSETIEAYAEVCRCKTKQVKPLRNFVCIDTFDELLELPEVDAIFRAKGNWTARLAAVCIWRQKKLPATLKVIEDHANERCWKCFEEQWKHGSWSQISLVVD
jgi:hypothetical protein